MVHLRFQRRSMKLAPRGSGDVTLNPARELAAYAVEAPQNDGSTVVDTGGPPFATPAWV